MQRFAKVPVHAATILKSAESAILLERIRELTVGDFGRGQFCEATARWWKYSTPWLSVRRVQDIIKSLVDDGYAIRVQKYNKDNGHKESSLYGITAKGLQLLSIEKIEDLINPESLRIHDAEIDAYKKARDLLLSPNSQALTPDPALGCEVFSARGAKFSAHLLDSSSNKHYEVNTIQPFASLTSGVSSQQSENAAVGQSEAPTQTQASSKTGASNDLASSIYALYPRKVAKAAALKAIKKALVENPDIDIPEAVKEYAKATATWKEDDKRFIPYPASWFNGGCFMDDRAEWWKKSTTAPAVSRGRKI